MDKLVEFEDVNIIINFDNNKEEAEARFIEKKDNSVIIMMCLRLAHYIEENEKIYNKKAIIYFGNMLVKDYIRLPFENSYEDDDEMGKICLFPKSKYEFFFDKM